MLVFSVIPAKAGIQRRRHRVWDIGHLDYRSANDTGSPLAE